MLRNLIRLMIAILSVVSIATAQSPSASNEATEILVSLIKINTSNPPGNETQAAQYIKSLLDKEGIPSEIFESAPGRGNIVARLKGNSIARRSRLIGT
jgi:acetylornithine deacetylase/succinyl-diaminopimelate desuccinylase-like protein